MCDEIDWDAFIQITDKQLLSDNPIEKAKGKRNLEILKKRLEPSVFLKIGKGPKKYGSTITFRRYKKDNI